MKPPRQPWTRERILAVLKAAEPKVTALAKRIEEARQKGRQGLSQLVLR